MSRTPIPAVLALLLLPALARPARAETQITLQDTFLEKYKDRVTLDATFTVDRAEARPARPEEDGVLHAAGRAPEIGLPAIAIVMAGAAQAEAVNLLHAAERSGRPLALRGVWRIWCGEGGDDQEVQGRTPPPAADGADPARVFALQPLLRTGGVDLGAGLQRAAMPSGVSGVSGTGETFRRFEQLASHITAGDGTATITTRMGGGGEVTFDIRLEEEPNHLLDDGLAIRAAVLDADGAVLVRDRRILAATGTPPYARLRALHKGATLRVTGLPRIDLSQVAWRLANSARIPGVLDWSLPYEMVLVAVYDAAPDAASTSQPAAAADSGDGNTQAAARPPLVVPATPAEAAGEDVIQTLVELLSQALPASAARGACTFAGAQHTYCGALSGPQCERLGGAFHAGATCPPPGGVGAGAPGTPTGTPADIAGTVSPPGPPG